MIDVLTYHFRIFVRGNDSKPETRQQLINRDNNNRDHGNIQIELTQLV